MSYSRSRIYDDSVVALRVKSPRKQQPKSGDVTIMRPVNVNVSGMSGVVVEHLKVRNKLKTPRKRKLDREHKRYLNAIMS
jgi:hypothetical protein